MKFWTIFWIFFIVIKCSSSDEKESEKSETFSSDDESTLNGGNNSDTELTEAIDDLDINEKSSEYQRKNHLKQQITSPNGARPLSCIDGNGREVDWWFLYKAQDSTQYLYYSSLDVQNNHTSFLPLNRKFLIDDIRSSPVLKTIYHPDNMAESSEVWLGWNDQPENEDNEETGKKSKDQKDAYGGNVSGVKHAHSKGFYAQNAVIDPKFPNQVTIGSYLMMTSLPRFPRVFSSANKLYGDALRNVLPRNPAEIFDSNLGSKAQHFFCMSLPRETVELEKNHKVYEVPVNLYLPHVKFLHKYLKTIHPAIMGTNFSDHKSEHRLWRRYFSLLQYPSEQAFSFLRSKNLNEQAMAFSKANLPSLDDSKTPQNFQHVFPLTWSNFYVSAQGVIIKNSSTGFYRWDAQFSNQNGCKTGKEKECLASFAARTTGLQSQIPLTFFAKHGLVHMDLYDDWAALHVVESQKNLENHYAGTVIDRYGLLVQSWIDSRTELPRKSDKKIFDGNGKLMATVHIDNVSHYDLPVKNGGTIRAHSNHRDHSKWAIAFAMETLNTNDESLNGSENTFIPSIFVADLNRTFTQARLKNSKQGRGGGGVVTESRNLWRALIKLNPRAGKQDRFANSSKNQARTVQNRLRAHVSLEGNLSSLPLDPLRPAFFKSLRLSKKESKKPALKSIDFVPFLNEISEFVKESENLPEHVSFLAFQKMFKSFAKGEIKGQAVESLKRAKNQNEAEEDAEYSCLLEWPEIITLPSLHLHRQIPHEHEFDDEYLKRLELEGQSPFIIKDSKGKVKRGDGVDSFMNKLNKIRTDTGTQTETVKQIDTGTSTDPEPVRSVSIDTSTEQVTNDTLSTTAHVTTDNLDSNIFKLIESMERNRISSKPSSRFNSNREEEEDDEQFSRRYYNIEGDDVRYNGGGSDSDYSNREIDYDDYEEFDEDNYDPYDHLNEKPDQEKDSDQNEDSDQDEDSSDSESDHGTEYYDHYRRFSRQNNGDESEYESE